MLPLLLVLQVAAADSIPRITLSEALTRATRLDPAYVAAEGQVAAASWARRAARAVFILPAVSISADQTWYTAQTFNIGTATQQAAQSTARLDARYDLFDGGQKFANLSRAGAALQSAEATAVQARFRTALLTESDYYTVLANAELRRVSAERVRRADEQLGVARARVVSGAAVQTDSLLLVLEATRARVGLLQQEAALRVSRLQLGRRVGLAGPVDAAPLDTLPAGELPFTVDNAVAEALSDGPSFRVFRARERAADAQARAGWGMYLPRVTLSGGRFAFDEKFFPNALVRWFGTVSISLPLWDNGQREVSLAVARIARDVARAEREDAERAARRDVTEAYDAYTTARASADFAAQAVVVAREIFRVQDTRYRAGATTILDLIEAQIALSEAEAGLVQAGYATRLAYAGIESILGRRLTPIRGVP